MDILDNEQRENELRLKKYAKIIASTRVVIFIAFLMLCFYDFCDYWARQQYRAALEGDSVTIGNAMADAVDITCVVLFLSICLLSFKKPIISFIILLIPSLCLSCGSSILLLSIFTNKVNYTPFNTAKIPLIIIWWVMSFFLIRGIIAAQKRRKVVLLLRQ